MRTFFGIFQQISNVAGKLMRQPPVKCKKYVRHTFSLTYLTFVLDLEKEPQNKMESSVLGSGAVVNGCCRGRLALRDVAAVKGRQQCTPYVPRVAGWLLCSVLSEASQLASFPTAPGCSAVITNISRALLCQAEESPSPQR